MTTHLGNSYYTTGHRLFKQKWDSNLKEYIQSLISWADKRCVECGRFVPKKNRGSRCHNCSLEYRKEYKRKDYYKNYGKNQEWIDYFKTRNFVNWNADKLNVGDYIKP